MARLFDIQPQWVWCNDSQQLEKRLEVKCGIQTNRGTVLVERRAFATTIPEAFQLRAELDADCLSELQMRSSL